ncbi:hypothetical protein UA32_12025 [Photobacterium angustum]|uniref:Uncharacterized protein n=1 Tax=Photobacterium angustum TaxID=661 RepID=A0ABX5GYK6_PHOAN|nr:hypothetical protein [Photobacterium angustum]KJG37684.1 hypothetical protein UA32_12025 [Photobacterium angustum]PSX03984.1 hypothetical protein C0W27_21050 [Photobacterium angustum]
MKKISKYTFTTVTYKGKDVKVIAYTSLVYRSASKPLLLEGDKVDVLDDDFLMKNKLRIAKHAVIKKTLDIIYGTSASLMATGFVSMLTKTDYSISVSLFVIGLVVMIITSITQVLNEVFYKDSG